MQKTTISYHAIVDEKKSPGIAKKIENTIIAAKQLGFTSKKIISPCNTKGKFNFIKKLATDDSKIVFIRYCGIAYTLALPILLLLRIKGKKIIVDIPTPRRIALHELNSEEKDIIKRTLKKLHLYLTSSWILFPANLIVQYANESKYFELGVRTKTIKIGNGILIENSTKITRASWPSPCLNLIAVAQIADWHGYDRLLKALHLVKKSIIRYQIKLSIVGDGESLPKLKELAKELDLKNVRFTGLLSGEELDSEFEGKHIGISSLGLYRKKLNEASDLKTREYMARGLCVIGAGQDPDFDDNSPFRFTAPNSDETIKLKELLVSFQEREIPSPQLVREFAESNLSIKSKLAHLLEIINHQEV